MPTHSTSISLDDLVAELLESASSELADPPDIIVEADPSPLRPHGRVWKMAQVRVFGTDQDDPQKHIEKLRLYWAQSILSYHLVDSHGFERMLVLLTASAIAKVG